MPKLPMDNTEIMISYRNAENPEKQIEILAQLNACTPETIADILQKQGASLSNITATAVSTDHTKRCRTIVTEELRQEINRLWQEGKPADQIAKHLGISKQTVWRHADRKRLTSSSSIAPSRQPIPPKNLPLPVEGEQPPLPSWKGQARVEAYFKLISERMDAATKHFQQGNSYVACICIGELLSAMKALQNEIGKLNNL